MEMNVIAVEPLKTPETPPPSPASKDKLGDTSKLSVFEIFGLPKPSQTQPMAPLNLETLSQTGRITPIITEPEPVTELPVVTTSAGVETPTPEIVVPKPASIARQVGKRALMRRKLGNVRNRFEA
jgi:hypothetical protein